ncbi:MAG: hydrogenase maturation protease [Candidatus Competibacter sp.]
MRVPGLLILAVGNPSRGDDALGPLFLERLGEWRERGGDWEGVELLTDFQLQIEHAVDLENRALVLFVDASVSCPPPYQFARLRPARDTSYTSHALSPAAVLHVYEQINRVPLAAGIFAGDSRRALRVGRIPESGGGSESCGGAGVCRPTIGAAGC